MARTHGLVCLLVCLASLATSQRSSAATEPPPIPTTPDVQIAAVWKVQQLNFVYHSDNVVYGCGQLLQKLKVILVSVGASDRIELRSYHCDERAGLARFEVRIESPAAATQENIQALATHTSRDELVARVNGERLPSAEDVQVFQAEWRTVSFARNRRMALHAADCELVEQVQRQLLPRLSVQIVRDNVLCSPAFGNISPPRLTVSALFKIEEET